MQEPSIYSAVIEAIAMGYTKTNHLEKKILHERQSMVFRILCFVSGTDMYLQIVRSLRQAQWRVFGVKK